MARTGSEARAELGAALSSSAARFGRLAPLTIALVLTGPHGVIPTAWLAAAIRWYTLCHFTRRQRASEPTAQAARLICQSLSRGLSGGGSESPEPPEDASKKQQ